MSQTGDALDPDLVRLECTRVLPSKLNRT